MGRGDGTGRLASPPDADDTGAGILHVDMDAFFAAVAVLDDPTLKGKPIIVGAPEGRGVVSSASYEARRFGVRSAMPVGQALRLCPTAIVVSSPYARYLEESAKVMDVFRSFTPLVEPLSIDEAFLDVRGARRLWGPPGQIARMLRERVLAETGLTCSVGAAATKHVAKIASTLSKPDGLLIVAEADTARFLAPLSVRALWGVGPKASEALENRGIRTVADVLQTPDAVIDRVLGAAMGTRIRQLVRGVDARSVETTHVEKSIGHEETFEVDIADDAVLRSELRRLADRVGGRLRSHGWEAMTVAIKVRFADFTTISRSQTLAEPTDVGQRIGDAAHELFAGVDRRQAVRLVGVRAERLRPAGQTPTGLWDDDAEWRRVEGALDVAAAKFGRGAVTRANLLGPQRGGGTLPSNPRPAGLDQG
ncbi:DNA polymerase-4 [Microbacterium terrae]|uniref:DNA polymerase IV n=1 Tax=Microbacterium terrae TaxID=69369 RepID=A0A0M2H4P3_9MICO|nr:DNA polymerase IV [Microbacterium terrae]KJL38873.1 DNA polymerase IV [Microbacterium terrae]MBP1077187.1 DNA polymerase-4 [Microbacterium terrae]GLJ99780.1 DNA polymerase IV [Microbacterium terrae]